MSTRAYRIIEIKTENEASFNLSHQPELTDYLGYYSDDGSYNIDREDLAKFLKDKKKQAEFEVEPEQLAQLQRDYDATDGEDEISYYTY